LSKMRRSRPKGLKEEVKLVMRAAYCLPEKGIAKLEEQADWLEKSFPSAAASLREGLKETFTINRLGLLATLRRCLGTTMVRWLSPNLVGSKAA